MSNKLKYAFRITHIDNIQHIAKYGIVRSDSPMKDINYVPIGDQEIIHIRSVRDVNGHKINEYIPFYLGPRSPMLYVIQHGYNQVKRIEPEKIVYCIIRLDDLIENDIDCVFTDGHAISKLTQYYNKDMLPRIDEIIKYDDVYSTFWNSETDIDLKRRKEAELLVKNDLPVHFIKGFAVYNEVAKQQMVDIGISAKLIAVKPQFYF